VQQQQHELLDLRSMASRLLVGCQEESSIAWGRNERRLTRQFLAVFFGTTNKLLFEVRSDLLSASTV